MNVRRPIHMLQNPDECDGLYLDIGSLLGSFDSSTRGLSFHLCHLGSFWVISTIILPNFVFHFPGIVEFQLPKHLKSCRQLDKEPDRASRP
jgi:hypothetical protein